MNGEITVNINGKEETLKFSMWQMEKMNELTGTKPGSISFAKTALIYSALLCSYRRKKEACPYEMDEVDVWADDLTTHEEGTELLKQINNCFIESYAFKTLISEAETAKKNGVLT